MPKQKEFDRVVSLWSPIREKAYWTVLRIVSDRQQAEDVLQESIIAAMEHLHTLRDDAKFESWFLTIAVRKAYRQLSQNKVCPLQRADTLFLDEETGCETEGFLDEVFDRARYGELLSAIHDRLATDERRFLFHLRYVLDKPIGEIAAITGIKEGTLKSIYSRIRRDIGESIRKEGQA